MATTSLSPAFVARTAPAGVLSPARRRVAGSAADMLTALREAPFDSALDYLHSYGTRLVERDEAATAVLTLEELAGILAEEDSLSRADSDLHTAILSTLTALHIERQRLDEALVTGAAALSLLAADPRRKDEPFLACLGCLLFDLAQAHAARGELKSAEREVEKAVKVLERLARTDANRYGPAHIMAMDASAGIYRSSVKQANVLAHAQVATATYLEMMKAGGDDAAMRTATDGLIDSLTTQGATLMQMGKPRQAVGFFTRALKLLTRINPETDLRSLALSIDLGEALVATKATRDKGVHLLNTMLHKATRLGADDLHRRIVDSLVNVKTNRLDILSIWHKIFPR
ncbi:MAG: hypothetical protein NC187_09990 [Candidatus Amulumruptor caecigallinarius]|nr:hypothetical protein [Candidatus Amulumruptor caecigallinarius]MCM1397796.1 hypothetical protein [Candidatus Amulumruptor caecigallinarius]MCM1454844.1 hypothetical protein [bacterium]